MDPGPLGNNLFLHMLVLEPGYWCPVYTGLGERNVGRKWAARHWQLATSSQEDGDPEVNTRNGSEHRKEHPSHSPVGLVVGSSACVSPHLQVEQPECLPVVPYSVEEEDRRSEVYAGIELVDHQQLLGDESAVDEEEVGKSAHPRLAGSRIW